DAPSPCSRRACCAGLGHGDCARLRKAPCVPCEVRARRPANQGEFVMKNLHILCCAVLSASIVPHAIAIQTAQEQPKTTTIQVKTTKLLRAGGDLAGKSLVNKQNETLGKCEDVVIHPRGEVAFVEFSGAGASNTGAKRYPIPWRALEMNDDGQFV